MRFVVIVSIFLFILGGCTCRQASLLIDSFEGNLDKTTVDFGAGRGSKVNISASKQIKKCGEQSLRIEYESKPSGYMWVARGYDLDVKGAAKWIKKPQEIPWKKFNAFSFWMYGNNSGHIIAFDIKDNGGEMHRFIIEDNFKGWKKIICPFKDFFPRSDWQPQKAVKNGVLDFPVKSFQFEPRTPGKGVIYIDCVRLEKIKNK